MLKHGMDEGEEGYQGGFLGLVFEKLAMTMVDLLEIYSHIRRTCST